MKNLEKRTTRIFWTVLMAAVLVLCCLTSFAFARVYSVTIETSSVTDMADEPGSVEGTDPVESDFATIKGTVAWNLPEGYEVPQTVNLLVVRSDGEQMEFEAAVENGSWSIEGLPLYEEEGADPFTYTVEQVLPDDSIYAQTSPAPDIVNGLKTVEVGGTVTWNVPENVELPEAVEVLVYRSDNAEGPFATAAATKEGGWEYLVKELPRYAPDGTEFEYTVAGAAVDGFEVSNEDGTIVYTAIAALSVSGTKVWDLPEGYEIPESIDIVIERSDGETLEATVFPDENGEWSVGDLPGVSEDGSTTFEYTVRENLSEESPYQQVGEGNDFVNQIKSVTYKGNVGWVDYKGDPIDPASSTLPTDVAVELQKVAGDGTVETVATVSVTAGEDGLWAFDFPAVVKYAADGTEIQYQVVETSIGGIAVDAASYTVQVSEVDGVVCVSNALKMVQAQFMIQKVYYADASSQANARFTFLVDAVDENGAARQGGEAACGADGTYIDDGVASFGIAAFAEGFVDGVAIAQTPAILYTQPGEYYYQVREADAESHEGWDTSVYTVHVSVGVDEQSGALTCAVEYLLAGQAVEVPTFTNNDSIWLSAHSLQVEEYTYSAEGTSRREVWVDPKIRVEFLGGVMSEGMFTFELYQVDESGAQVGETYIQTNDAYGVVDFDLLGSWSEDTNQYALFNYTEPGIYWYAMRQIPGDDPRIEYSDTVVYYCIEVFEVGEAGALDYSASYSHTPGTLTEWPDPTVTNTAKAIDLQLQKFSVDGDPLEGAVYSLWMVNENGNDAYIGSATSDADGWMTFADVNMVIGSWYYFQEEVAPSGHLVDPYSSETFTLVADEDGLYLMYQVRRGN